LSLNPTKQNLSKRKKQRSNGFTDAFLWKIDDFSDDCAVREVISCVGLLIESQLCLQLVRRRGKRGREEERKRGREGERERERGRRKRREEREEKERERETQSAVDC
jgi:hypothetical protein